MLSQGMERLTEGVLWTECNTYRSLPGGFQADWEYGDGGAAGDLEFCLIFESTFDGLAWQT